jgi:hypothetical protein
MELFWSLSRMHFCWVVKSKRLLASLIMFLSCTRSSARTVATRFVSRFALARLLKEILSEAYVLTEKSVYTAELASGAAPKGMNWTERIFSFGPALEVYILQRIKIQSKVES